MTWALTLLLLAEAGRVLERGQAAAGLRLRRFLAATDRCQNGRRADQPAEEEGLQAVPPFVTVHATILGVIVCTLGDLLLDVVARLARLMVPGDDAPRLIDIGPGGESHAARPAGLDCGIELGLDAAALFVARQGTAA